MGCGWRNGVRITGGRSSVGDFILQISARAVSTVRG